MACIECGLDQAGADAGTCARCGASLTDHDHPSGAFTCRNGAELMVDSRGVTLCRSRKARAHLVCWEEIRLFRDGWHGSENPGWVLHIMLADGLVKPARETWLPGRAQAPPELVALIKRAAAAHSIPAVLTGGMVHDGLPGEEAGLYYDPAGQPGVREWTGTGWSPFLRVDPGPGGHRDQETGLAAIWSPLPATELDRQSRVILQDARNRTTLAVVVVGGLGLGFISSAVLVAATLGGSTGNPWAVAATLGVFGVLSLAIMRAQLLPLQGYKRIALALHTDAVRMSAEDDTRPPITPETP
jgi:hypothetical protein